MEAALVGHRAQDAQLARVVEQPDDREVAPEEVLGVPEGRVGRVLGLAEARPMPARSQPRLHPLNPVLRMRVHRGRELAQAEVCRLRPFPWRGREGDELGRGNVIQERVAPNRLRGLDQQPTIRVVVLQRLVVAALADEFGDVADPPERQVECPLAKLLDKTPGFGNGPGPEGEGVVDGHSHTCSSVPRPGHLACGPTRRTRCSGPPATRRSDGGLVAAPTRSRACASRWTYRPRRARRAGTPSPSPAPPGRWTPEDDAVVTSLPTREAAAKLVRTINSVYRRRLRLRAAAGQAVNPPAV